MAVAISLLKPRVWSLAPIMLRVACWRMVEACWRLRVLKAVREETPKNNWLVRVFVEIGTIGAGELPKV